MSQKHQVTQLIQLSPAQLRELLRAKVLYVRTGTNVMSEELYTKIRLGDRPRVA